MGIEAILGAGPVADLVVAIAQQLGPPGIVLWRGGNQIADPRPGRIEFPQLAPAQRTGRL
jgi:hypothetical protein